MYITYTSCKRHNIYGVLLNFIFLIIKEIFIYFPEQGMIFFLHGHNNFHLDRPIKKWHVCIFQTIPWKELAKALWSPQGPTGPGKYDKAALFLKVGDRQAADCVSFPVQTLHLCRPVFSRLLPGKVTSLRRDKNQWHHVSSGAQTLQETGALVEWGPGQLSAAPTWVCCSSSPQGLTLEVTFMVFPVTLAIYGLPALSPAVAVLSGQLLSGLLVVPSLEEFAKISHQCFTGPRENKRALLERGPLLLLGKTFSVSAQQRRESWYGGPWLQPPEELGAGVPQLVPLLEIVIGVTRLGIARLTYSPGWASSHTWSFRIWFVVFLPPGLKGI